MTRACFKRFDPLLERIPVTQDIKTYMYRIVHGDNNITTGSASVTDKATD